ncbi:MAG: TIGR02300 family protein [Rhodospirillaceae bacterium]|nr:TIGR02300 family protein [Rhodospirillales bacterium]
MASANWGTKRRCASCAAAFYDLNRAPIICPKCQSAYVAAPPRLPMRASRARPVEPVLPEPVEADAFEEDEVLEHPDDTEDGETPPDVEGDEEELRE